ncbi:MAG: hypothetical protein DRI98_07000 [Bacteroidetes bacterium]|nr:MAG: hypothetical protein DRI98_07000 [Bacteroidota bacterium]
MKRYFTIIILALTCLTACDEFLDVIPTGKVIPNTVEDFDKLLNNPSLVYNTWGNMAYMDPDLYMPENNYNNMWQSKWRKQYTWSEDPIDEKDQDPDWNTRYKYIYVYNTIINHIDEAPLGSRIESDRALVKGDAFAQRAMDYFLLVNEYAPHVTDDTWDTPAIPMPLVEDLQIQLPRSTIGEIYDRILADLSEAETLLADGPAIREEANFRPGTASVKALLGTIYLYFGDWALAEQYTSEALAQYDFVYDFNELDHIVPGEPWSAFDNDREFLYTQDHKSSVWGRTHRTWFYDPANLYSPSLRDLYNHETDRRWYLQSGEYTWYDQRNSTLPNYVFIRDYAATNAGMTSPRLMLDNAEAKVRNGDGPGAIDMLNQLAVYRYTTRDTTFTYTTDAAALQEVKDERRRELCFTGVNFIDQKRYHAYGETIPTFTRTIPDGETFTLEPGSDKWVVPIARLVQYSNPNL